MLFNDENIEGGKMSVEEIAAATKLGECYSIFQSVATETDSWVSHEQKRKN
jgi:hypothetical protein